MRVLLTRIRREVARRLAGIGMNLESITTRGALQNGIVYVLGCERV